MKAVRIAAPGAYRTPTHTKTPPEGDGTFTALKTTGYEGQFGICMLCCMLLGAADKASPALGLYASVCFVTPKKHTFLQVKENESKRKTKKDDTCLNTMDKGQNACLTQ